MKKFRVFTPNYSIPILDFVDLMSIGTLEYEQSEHNGYSFILTAKKQFPSVENKLTEFCRSKLSTEGRKRWEFTEIK